MILRRIAEAIRAQNWFTVILEILIVVIGIFIGLQVDDWNEARKLKQREAQLVARLQSDFLSMIDSAVRTRAFYESKLDSLFHTLGALDTCSLNSDMEGVIEKALMEYDRFSPPVVIRDTYDEMVAEGALARINNIELKKAITDVFTNHETSSGALNQIANQLNIAGQIIQRYVFYSVLQPAANQGSSGDIPIHSAGISVEYEFQQLCESREFRNALASVFSLSQAGHILANQQIGITERAVEVIESREDYS